MPDLLSVGLVELPASDLPHFSCAQRLLAERMTTIVAYFRAQVVNFIFFWWSEYWTERKRKEKRETTHISEGHERAVNLQFTRDPHEGVLPSCQTRAAIRSGSRRQARLGSTTR